MAKVRSNVNDEKSEQILSELRTMKKGLEVINSRLVSSLFHFVYLFSLLQEDIIDWLYEIFNFLYEKQFGPCCVMLFSFLIVLSRFTFLFLSLPFLRIFIFFNFDKDKQAAKFESSGNLFRAHLLNVLRRFLPHLQPTASGIPMSTRRRSEAVPPLWDEEDEVINS